MAKYEVKETKNKEEWEKFVLSHGPTSFLQSWNWGETNKITGNKIFRLSFLENKKIIGVCLIVKQKAKRGSHFLIPGGPIIDWENKTLVGFCIKTIKDLAKTEKAWFVRIRPELSESNENRNIFKRLGFISAPMHLHAENTWILDITPSEELLLSGMRKTTRYLIRKSSKIDLVLETTTNPEASKILKELQDETVTRLGFVGFSEKLFKAQLSTFGKDKQAKLFICRKGREALVAAIIIFYGDYAYYHHSGSTSRYRKIPSSYFLQWKIIQEAKKRGHKYYNFWGIAPNDNPKHRFAGVTLFKKGFGGKKIDWLHAHDLPISPFYWFTYVFETRVRIFRRL